MSLIKWKKKQNGNARLIHLKFKNKFFLFFFNLN